MGMAWYAALNRRDLTSLQGLVDDACVWELATPAPDGARLNGSTAIVAYLNELFRVAPHAAWRIENLHGFGRQCVVYWRGEVPSTEGHSTLRRGVDVFEVREGLARQIKSYVKG